MIIASLEDLAKLDTPQKVFDFGAKHLLEQNKKSQKRDFCAYRGPDGLACGAGCFIPESEYHWEFEEVSVNALDDQCGASPQILDFIDKNVELLQQIQVVHDGSPPSGWPINLEAVAEKFDLSTEFLEGLTG
jgi:hypothetical protein